MVNDETSARQSKCRALRRGMVVVLFFLCLYICVLQGFSGKRLSASGERQQSRLTYLPARRGDILARGGEVLNGTCAQYDLTIRLDRIRDPRDTLGTTLNKAEAAIAELGAFLGGDYYENRPSRKALDRHIRRYAPLPFVVWTNADADIIARFSEAQDRFPYAELSMSWRREYYHGNLAAHVRGFVSRTAEGRRPADWPKGVLLSCHDIVGRSGVELWCDGILGGESGFTKIQTDVLSFRHGTIETRGAVPGSSVRLTLDLGLQRRAEELLTGTGHAGGLVLLDARNGDVLVMASHPAHYLPPLREDHELAGGYTNRTTQGYYPPGSTMKPLIALAALERGVITAEDTVFCPGYYRLPDGRKIKCSSRHGHGEVNVVRALAVSCNVFFCEVGNRLGQKGFSWMEKQARYGGLFGKKTGVFGGKSEISGVFYGPEWIANHRFDDISWRADDSALAGIGQGAWVVTPLQMAVYACALTSGRLITPRILLQEGEKTGAAPAVSWPGPAWIPVLQGLQDCIQTPVGTGRRAALPGMQSYGKTGTAEHVGDKEPHAWMFMSAPTDNPRFVAACVIEEGGHGGAVAGPVVKGLMEAAFEWERKGSVAGEAK